MRPAGIPVYYGSPQGAFAISRKPVYLTMRRKIGIYLLLCGFSLSVPGANQLFKLPGLLEHYFEHRSEDAGLGFMEYLHQHFVDSGSHRHQGHAHDKLPFAGGHCALAQYDFAKLLFRRQATDFSRDCTAFTAEILIPRNTSLHLPSFHTDIWNPPKA